MQRKWDRRFMARAKSLASWSKDPKHQVGAVIIDCYNHVISEGYNGPPRGVEDTELHEDKLRLRTLHAEMNAILHGIGRNMEGATMYVYPYFPCATCAAMAIQVGIKKIYYSQIVDLENWRNSQREAMLMLQEAGVEYYLLDA